MDQKLYEKRHLKNKLFHLLLAGCILFSITALALLLYDIFSKGLGWLDWQFLTSMPSRSPEKAGILSALVGSVWVIGLTSVFSLILGVGTAVYLEEYTDPKKLINRIIQLNISNLAGVPAIVYGLLGLAFFVRFLGFDKSILSGALTLTLLILPVITVASQEAIRSVPRSLREASYSLGTTKLQTITGVVLPYAMPGILTGSILAISRAMGEAAPLIMVGAAGYIAFLPKGPMDWFTVLPVQIFNWTSRPQEEFQYIAAAGIIVLMAVLLSANAVAILLRNKYQNRMD
jgi:phosphate transport system permease protein